MSMFSEVQIVVEKLHRCENHLAAYNLIDELNMALIETPHRDKVLSELNGQMMMLRHPDETVPFGIDYDAFLVLLTRFQSRLDELNGDQ